MRLYPAWIKNKAEFLSLPVLERALHLAAARVGEIPLMASDLVHALPEAFHRTLAEIPHG